MAKKKPATDTPDGGATADPKPAPEAKAEEKTEAKTEEKPPEKPKAEKAKGKKAKKKGERVPAEGRARMAELAAAADPECAEMHLLATHPQGMDGRTIASLVSGTRSETFSRLNSLVYAGLARKTGSFYQATPKGIEAGHPKAAKSVKK